jgi:CelD/BcsL family acetyltransferase involved in cellulose biosynthesis
VNGPEDSPVPEKPVLRAAVLRERALIRALEPAYRALFDALPNPNPFLSPEWVYAWVNTLGSRFDLCFVVCFEGETLRGVWPFFQQPVPLLRPLLLPVAAQVADLFDPIAEPSALPALWEQLRVESVRYSAVWLPLLSDAWVSHPFRGFLEASRIRSLLRRRTTRLQIDLLRHPAFGDYVAATFQNRTRQSLRRKQRRMEQAGPLEWVTCDTPEAMEAQFPGVVALERASWKASRRAGIFKDPAHNAFYFILLQELARHGRVRLSLLKVGEALAAFELGVLGSDRYCMHAMAFHPRFSKYSPGKLLALSVLSGCFTEERPLYDFMQNDQEFKREMSNREEPLWDCVWVQPGIVGYLILAVVRLLHFWKSGREKAEKSRGVEPG